MASRKPPGRSPPPPPGEFGEAEAPATEITFAPDFDDDSTEDTDKHDLAAIKRKLTLPSPNDLDEDTPRAPIAALPSVPIAPPKAKPTRVSVFRVKPETSGSGRLVLGTVGVLLAVIGLAFALAPDARTRAQTAREKGVRAGDLGDPAKRKIYSYKDAIQLQNPDMIVISPRSSAPLQPLRPLAPNPAPARERHAIRAIVKQPTVVEKRYGFERVEQVKRHYDNFDSTLEQGSGVPMLMVFSQPSGMSVDVEGKLMGMTPLIRAMPKDTKRVKVRLYGAGFKEWEQTVSANQIEQFRVGVTMQRIGE